MCTLREKYKGTKFPNETNFIDRSQILMFFLNIETYTFSSECNHLRLEQSLEFNQAFLSLKEFKMFSKDIIRKLIFLFLYAVFILSWKIFPRIGTCFSL